MGSGPSLLLAKLLLILLPVRGLFVLAGWSFANGFGSALTADYTSTIYLALSFLSVETGNVSLAP